MKSRIGTTARKLLLAAIAGLIGLLIAEAALRTFFPQATLYPRYSYSPEFPVSFPENSRLIHSRGSQWKFVYTTNALGRRGPHIPISDTDDTTTIVVLGDSYTFGQGVSDENVYTHTLSQVLGDDFSVINGGMPGWGIDAQIKWYFETGADYRPDYVVLQFSANDPSDSVAGFTTIEGGEFKFHPNAHTRSAWQLFLSNSSILQKSHLYALLRDSTRRQSARHSRFQTPAPESDEAQTNYVNLLRLFASKLKAQGTPLIFVSVTHGPNVTCEKHHFDSDHFPAISAALTQLDAAGALDFVDLPIAAMEGEPESPEGHRWGPAHHRRVGQEIARWIQNSEASPSKEGSAPSLR